MAEKEDYALMMKAATAVMIVGMSIFVLMVIGGWIALIIMSLAFLWAGVTTMETNLALAIIEVLVGTCGLVLAGFILLLYSENT